MPRFTARKPVPLILADAAEEGTRTLKRALGPANLIALGVGAIIGTGIFVLTGTAAAHYAGPAVMLAFVIAAAGCAVAGLCYAELAAMIPVSGSAYTYGYATLGELLAWVIGWDLILEYSAGAAAVASGWSAYLYSLLQDWGVQLPPALAGAPGTELVLYEGRWVALGRVLPALQAAGVDPATLPQAVGSFNVLAFAGVAGATALLVFGVRASANYNFAAVLVKLGVLLIFVVAGAAWILDHRAEAAANWTPFVPPNRGEFGDFGASGVVRAAGILFFAYLGFDAVSTAAQEARRPKRDMPLGILGSLFACTLVYVLVAGVLTGMVRYTELDVADPLVAGMEKTGLPWGGLVVKAGAVVGLSSTLLVLLLGQSRILFSMSRDGLLPAWGARIHQRFRTPWLSSALVGLVVGVAAGLVPVTILSQLVSIGTLLAFIIVCAGVWALRRTQPDLYRPFRVPLVPLVPALGIAVALLMMVGLPRQAWVGLGLWQGLGLVIYLAWGSRHSLVQRALDGPTQP